MKKHFIALAIIALAASSIPVARAQDKAAPGAGGYNSEFGTDYRVGEAKKYLRRQPIYVMGVRVHSRNGQAQQWVAPRFADALSRQLQRVAGIAPGQAELGKTLAQFNARPEMLGLNAIHNASAKNALTRLHAEYSKKQKTARLLVLFGEMSLNNSVMKPTTFIALKMQLRYFAPREGFSQPLEIAFTAPAREYSQLAARAALAICDTAPFTMSYEERTDFLRAASPLNTPATPALLNYEKRVGEAVLLAADAMRRRAQLVRIPLEKRPTAQVAAQAVQSNAQTALRVLSAAPKTLAPHDKIAASEAARSAREWLAALGSLGPFPSLPKNVSTQKVTTPQKATAKKRP